jgi:hypothetical protein
VPEGNLGAWFEKKVVLFEHLMLFGEVEFTGLSVRYDNKHQTEVGSLNMLAVTAAFFEVLDEKPAGLLPLPAKEVQCYRRIPDKDMKSMAARMKGSR